MNCPYRPAPFAMSIVPRASWWRRNIVAWLHAVPERLKIRKKITQLYKELQYINMNCEPLFETKEKVRKEIIKINDLRLKLAGWKLHNGYWIKKHGQQCPGWFTGCVHYIWKKLNDPL